MLPAAAAVDAHRALVDEVGRPGRPRRGEAVPQPVADQLVRDDDRRRRVLQVGLEVLQAREEDVVRDARRERVERLRDLVAVADPVAVGVEEARVGVVREYLVVGRDTVPVAVGDQRVLAGERVEENGEWRVNVEKLRFSSI